MSFENLPALSVMIGRNNAGKSNLIKALDWNASMSSRNAEFSTHLLHRGNRDKPLIVNVQFELSCDERESVLQLVPIMPAPQYVIPCFLLLHL